MDDKTKDIIRAMYPKAPAVEMDRLLHLAETSGLDPVQRHLYLIQRKGVWQIQTGIDGFRAVAGRNGLAGIDDAVFVEDDKGKPVSATVTVYKWGPDGASKAAYTATARFSEYCAGGPMWTRMPHTMVAKCAEALALRKAFSQLAGLYTADEMDQAGPGDDEPAPAPKPRKAARKPPPRTGILPPPKEEPEPSPLDGLGDDVRPAPSKDPEPPTDGDVMGPTALRDLVKRAQAHASMPFPQLQVLAVGPDDVFDVKNLTHRAKMQKACEALLAEVSTRDVDAALKQALDEHPDLKSTLLAVIDSGLGLKQQLAEIGKITQG